MIVNNNLYPVNLPSQVVQSSQQAYLKTEDDAAKIASQTERDSSAAFTKTLDWGAELNRQYVYSMLRLSDDIGTMADRIGVMADRILYTELQIGVMADRIITFSQMQSDNMDTTQQWLTDSTIKVLNTYKVNQNI
ncbi:MAG TPA: hypothetical protein EYO62_00595 [Aquificales bacterium]|nr:hypothetical protein [Aquificales bacterium]